VLERIHRPLLADAHSALEAVRSADSSIWERWGAAQYVEHELVPRWLREREALDAVLAKTARDEATLLWSLGELIELLSGELGELARLAQSGATFAALVDKLLKALECWCQTIECAASRVSSQVLPREAQARLAELAAASAFEHGRAEPAVSA
jgi:hypothetical protein